MDRGKSPSRRSPISSAMHTPPKTPSGATTPERSSSPAGRYRLHEQLHQPVTPVPPHSGTAGPPSLNRNSGHEPHSGRITPIERPSSPAALRSHVRHEMSPAAPAVSPVQRPASARPTGENLAAKRPDGRTILQAVESFNRGGQRLTELFKKHARTRPNLLSNGELSAFLRELMPKASSKELEYYKVMLDLDNDGQLGYQEMTRAFKDIRNAQKASAQGSVEVDDVLRGLAKRFSNEDSLKQLFNKHDTNHDGVMDAKELRLFLGAALPSLPPQQLRMLLADIPKIDKNSDGLVSIEELMEAINGMRAFRREDSTRGGGGASSSTPENRDRRSSNPGSTPKGGYTGGGESGGNLEEAIEGEILPSSPGVYWDDIAGLEQVKRDLNLMVILPPKRPDIFHGLRAPPKGVLLFGPPGTGKTLLAKAIATETDATFFSLSASALTSKYYGQGEKMVRALFQVARRRSPSIIFIDEIDSVLSSRSSNEHEASRRIKTEFLVQLDGLHGSDQGDELCLVVGATNRPFDLDEAILRRFPRRVYIPLPDKETRHQIILNLMGQMPSELRGAEVERLVVDTEGFSCSEVTALCKEAAMGPVRELDVELLATMPADQVRSINYRDFHGAFKKIKPSVQKAVLAKFSEWDAAYGGL